MCQNKRDRGIGFRDLHCFNVAMLSKQGKRLINHTHTLFDRIPKVKYFSKEDFLNGRRMKNASYT